MNLLLNWRLCNMKTQKLNAVIHNVYMGPQRY